MGENSGIQWTTHTFNPWEGCQRVSPGCQHCYAENRNHRFAGDDQAKVLWGPNAPRRRTSAANWRKPLNWNQAAAVAGERHRVFCASLADVFEDRFELEEMRLEVFDLIRKTPYLDWLLLTKRPQNVGRMISASIDRTVTAPWDTREVCQWLQDWSDGQPPANVWLGTTVEDQQRADDRIHALLKTPARVRFLSCEPLLEQVDLGLAGRLPRTDHPRINWVIVGGESGAGARPFVLDWARNLLRQCRASGAAPFVKQLGAKPVGIETMCDACSMGLSVKHGPDCMGRALRDPAGGDWDEWPADLRIREFPR